MSGAINVSRSPDDVSGRLVRYRVQVDGQTVGELKRGEDLLVEVSAGEHQVRLRSPGWGGSNTVNCVVRDGETVLLVQTSPPLIEATWRGLFRPGSALVLEVAEK